MTVLVNGGALVRQGIACCLMFIVRLRAAGVTLEPAALSGARRAQILLCVAGSDRPSLELREGSAASRQSPLKRGRTYKFVGWAMCESPGCGCRAMFLLPVALRWQCGCR